MDRVHGFYIYELANSIHPITQLTQGVTNEQAWAPLVIAEGSLNGLMHGSIFRLRACLEDGERLLELIRSSIKEIEEATNRTAMIDRYKVFELANSASRFEQVLKGDMGTIDLYYVRRKGSYDMLQLVHDGVAAFPDDVAIKTPSAVGDLREATKCLAYETFTACGFHLHRANEAVLRVYWDVVTNKAAPPKVQSMGTYLSELKKRRKGKKKVKAVLQEIKDLHRNPLIHPEHTLGEKQAIALMGLVHASITYMLEEIPESSPTSSPFVATT